MKLNRSYVLIGCVALAALMAVGIIAFALRKDAPDPEAKDENVSSAEKGKKDIEECIAIARESIDSGNALKTFQKFVELNS